jgi:hypothetical protein
MTEFFEMTKLLCLAVLSSIILVGCRVAQDVSCAAVAINRVSVTSVQYMASVGNAGAETVEVIVRNGTREPVSFVKAELDGVEFPKIVPSVQRALDAFRRGAASGRVGRPAESRYTKAGAAVKGFFFLSAI